MITKECNTQKMCLFCASDYHLEMILLPYIKTRIENTKFIIFTEKNLEPSLEKLLEKVNLDKETKQKIKNINWKNEEKYEVLQKFINEQYDINIIINGNMNYIKYTNKNIEKDINNKINIIDCFHVGDLDVDIEKVSLQYSKILNTEKI